MYPKQDEKFEADAVYESVTLPNQIIEITGSTIAIHECGHALAAVKGGVGIYEMLLGRRPIEGTRHTNLGGLNLTPDGDDRCADDPNLEILVSCGGPAAEILYICQERHLSVTEYVATRAQTWGGDFIMTLRSHAKITGEEFTGVQGEEERLKEIFLNYIRHSIGLIGDFDMKAVIALADRLIQQSEQRLEEGQIERHFRDAGVV